MVIDYLNGPPAEAELGVMGRGCRMVQVGSGLASDILLHAQTTRRAPLDVLRFGYYHAPFALQADDYDEFCRLAAASEIALHHEAMRLSD